jgi:hypothetical protein
MEPRNRFQWMNSASLCSLAGRYDNPIPTRFLAPIDCLKIPALKLRESSEAVGFWLRTPYVVGCNVVGTVAAVLYCMDIPYTSSFWPGPCVLCAMHACALHCTPGLSHRINKSWNPTWLSAFLNSTELILLKSKHCCLQRVTLSSLCHMPKHLPCQLILIM